MTDQTGSLATALTHAQRLLATKPALAEEQAREILKVVPAHPIATLVLASARRFQDDDAGALAVLMPLSKAQPNLFPVQYELGSVLVALGRGPEAIRVFEHAAQIDPNNAAVWRALGEQYTLVGNETGAKNAYARNIKASVNDPELIEAATALYENRLAVAERLLRKFLKEHPTDVAAIRMLAETASRVGVYDDAEKLLERALELAPDFKAARHNYATVLHTQTKEEQALAQVEILLKDDPKNFNYRALRAAILGRIGEYEEAIRSYDKLLRDYPTQPGAWMSLGHALKTVGRQDDSVAAYRRSIELLPNLGESYWSLANLKTVRFTADDVAKMRAQLARKDISDTDRFHLHFALGKALEDAGDYEESFAHYAKGNEQRRAGADYSADKVTDNMRRSKTAYTRELFQAREGVGCPAPDPIFIVSLPRAGSTLIEQILSSHSAVEGTMELSTVGGLIRGLETRKRRSEANDYPDNIAELPLEKFKELGEEYLRRVQVHRKLGRPFFIDKMPSNFLYIGFIHLILPNAKIIDARRHPLGCCFSNLKQHYARGNLFAYDQTELGRYYRDYVELTAHFDDVLPGRVHRVFYEDMVANPEAEIRALLEYCGLPFEESCLRYYENERAVRTASAQQVRQPIYTESLDQWRNFEQWLEPLRTALGPVLNAYPGVPDFPPESPAANSTTPTAQKPQPAK